MPVRRKESDGVREEQFQKILSYSYNILFQK
jgi:hypothetical protein